MALSLLFEGLVKEIVINDLDPAIHAFWKSTLQDSADFAERIRTVPLSPREWRRQRQIYQHGARAGYRALGFAMFYLNRTNHSGIMNAGMIGGRDQLGEWKLDARFNRAELVNRVEKIARFRDRIHVSGVDALDCLKRYRRRADVLFYLDPPYFRAGRDLYMNAYRPDDHANVRDAMVALKKPCVVSYDDVPQVRRLYSELTARRLHLLHTARTPRLGREVLFFSDGLRIPRKYRRSKVSRQD